MSESEAEAITNQFYKWDTKHARHDFIEKMERKMYKREKFLNHRSR